MLTRHIDTRAIRELTDLRAVVAADLGRPVNQGKASMYRCPFHSETHGASLAIWPDGWYCFGKCQTGGDAIAWVERFHHVSFFDACRALSGDALPTTAKRPYVMARRETPISQPPSAEWRATVGQLLLRAQHILHSPAGRRAREWLHARGIPYRVMDDAGLGYLPGPPDRWHRHDGIACPSGILIPWYVGGQLWGVKVRTAGGPGVPKYLQIGGGSISGGMYWAVGPSEGRNPDDWGIIPGWPVMLVEGEFDCLVAWNEGMDLICPVTLGSMSQPLNSRWLPLIWGASKILVALDNDAAGDEGAARLMEQIPSAIRARVPEGKDITEFGQKCGSGAVRSWIKDQVEGI